MTVDSYVYGLGAKLLEAWAEKAGELIFEKLKITYKNIVNKEKIDYGQAFEYYLEKAEKHISMSKTILYGQTPHHLYSFFECIGIADNEGSVDTNDINNVLSQGNKIIITGTGGIGKSMLMRHFFLNTVKNTSYVPVLIELRGLNQFSPDKISVEEYIFKFLSNFGLALEEEYFKYSLETGCYVFLFDGYDEVKNDNSQKVTDEILNFSNKYSDNHFILSSRPLEEFIGWSDFREYKSLHLTKEQAVSLIRKLEYDQEIKEKFIYNLEKELFQKYESFASNPLLLTIMLMTFEERVSIPDSKTDFYEQAFSTLYHKHDAMKKGRYKREKASGLGYEDFKRVFSYFCFRSFFKDQYEFTESAVLENIVRAKEKVLSYGDFQETGYLEDLTKAVCMLVHEGLNYRFSHRSFQEYFAAVFTTQLSDDEQKQFVVSWLKSVSGRMTTDFLDILLDLQPDRFMKNILYDPLYEFYNLYNANGKSDDWLLSFLYYGIELRTLKDGEERLIVVINQSYYFTMFICMLHYLHYQFVDVDHNLEYKEVIRRLKEKYPNRFPKGTPISFHKLKEDGMFEEVKNAISWALLRVKSVFDELDKIDINTFGNKKKFESMLDDL